VASDVLDEAYTALDSYARTADPALLTAATHSAELIDPPR
jgi:hypothetical protein